MEFRPVRCPECDRRAIGEIATGLARFKCPDCGRRVWASSNGHELRISMVDRTLDRVNNNANA